MVWLAQVLTFMPREFLDTLPTGPTIGLNTLATSVVGSGFFNHLGWVNAYFPVAEAITAMGIVIGVVTVMWVIRLVLWVLTKVHVLGGGSDD